MSSESEFITCEECKFSYNVEDSLPDCDWCEHMRSNQNCCPNCSGTIEEFNQTICFWCFYSGINIENEIIFCETCNFFCLNNDIFGNSYDHIGHDFLENVNEIWLKTREIYPKIFEMFS
jgi:uncharacterized protein YbaR (Trm112 family)